MQKLIIIRIKPKSESVMYYRDIVSRMADIAAHTIGYEFIHLFCHMRRTHYGYIVTRHIPSNRPLTGKILRYGLHGRFLSSMVLSVSTLTEHFIKSYSDSLTLCFCLSSHFSLLLIIILVSFSAEFQSAFNRKIHGILFLNISTSSIAIPDILNISSDIAISVSSYIKIISRL